MCVETTCTDLWNCVAIEAVDYMGHVIDGHYESDPCEFGARPGFCLDSGLTLASHRTYGRPARAEVALTNGQLRFT